ncbi:MAG: hypothetical protein HY273_03460 [Gammaproteobacteria bacterium]|nr:hypothetical protein [Gammaproteobacteria bacterium]
MATVRLFKQYIPAPFILLALIEFGIYALSAMLGVEARFFGSSSTAVAQSFGAVAPKALLFASVMLISAISMGLYKRSFREGISGILVRIGISFAMAMLMISLVFYVLPDLFMGRGVLGIALVLSFIGVAISRTAFFAVLDQDTFKRRILVLGSGKRAATMAQLRRRVDHRGFYILGFVSINGEEDFVDKERIIAGEAKMIELAQRYEADEVVVAMDDRRRGFPVHELLDCKMSGIEVVDLQTFFERETGKLRLDCMHPSWMIFSDGFGQSPLQDCGRRKRR